MAGKNKIDDKPSIFENLLNEVADPDQLYGIVSLRQLVKYASGARTILRINDEIVGFAFSISWNVSTDHKDIYTLDEYFPADTAPQFVQVSGQIGAFHIPGSGPTKQEYQANYKSFLQHKYITIEVRDTQTDELLFFTNKAYITNRSQSLNAGQLSKMTLNFRAIGWLDEINPTVEGVDIPEGYTPIGGGQVVPKKTNPLDI